MKQCKKILCPKCGYANDFSATLRCLRCHALLIVSCNGDCNQCEQRRADYSETVVKKR